MEVHSSSLAKQHSGYAQRRGSQKSQDLGQILFIKINWPTPSNALDYSLVAPS
jgi:hypothetical protein